jgi:hypothetical protein
MNWNTLYIFGFGQNQLITDTENKLVDSDTCPSTQSVADMVYALKPDGNASTVNYRAISIFNDLFADYSDDQGNRFRVDYSELNAALIDAVVIEVLK